MGLTYTGATGLLAPVIALNTWTFVMEAWVFGGRIAASPTMDFDNTKPEAQRDAHAPLQVRWRGANYNHLFEQPTQFYAVMLALSSMGSGNDRTNVMLAWAYVGIRIAHSLVQSIVNHIPTRASLFVASSGLLAILTGRAAMAFF